LVKEESSFSEEKEAKRLLFLRHFYDRGHGRDVAAAPEIKVFWFFSSEKNSLLAVAPHRPSAMRATPGSGFLLG
jgi:hypothetical protein